MEMNMWDESSSLRFVVCSTKGLYTFLTIRFSEPQNPAGSFYFIKRFIDPAGSTKRKKYVENLAT